MDRVQPKGASAVQAPNSEAPPTCPEQGPFSVLPHDASIRAGAPQQQRRLLPGCSRHQLLLGQWHQAHHHSLLVPRPLAFAGVYSNELKVAGCRLTWFQASRIYMPVLGFVVPMCTLCTLCGDLPHQLWALQVRSRARTVDKAKQKTPSHLASIVALATDLPQASLVIGISHIITSLSYASSCLNPFLYTVLDSSFCRNCRSTLQCRDA
ncbi:Neuropeptides B/W Receptor Type 2 [Manis pentadactyla]|nr:Neuropeptides B/W Receptor Type 2 [Manis pentadactyla]